jgi:hypothetical protein
MFCCCAGLGRNGSRRARPGRESLAIWREMVSFAADDDIHDAGRVNVRASAWASHVNALDMMVEEELSALRE